MSSDESDVDELNEQITRFTVSDSADINEQTTDNHLDPVTSKSDQTPDPVTLEPSKKTIDYYFNPPPKTPLGFARLEKGLLLFIYVYETVKGSLILEKKLFDRRVCFDLITTGKCNKHPSPCHGDHKSTYRQLKLCSFWYGSTTCNAGANCKSDHQLTETPTYHKYIRTTTDYDVYQLIQFIRNFAGHYLESYIQQQLELYMDMIITMLRIIHALSPKKNDKPTAHLDEFLGRHTTNRLVPEVNLLIKLKQSYEVPELFFRDGVPFQSTWYPSTGDHRCVDFNLLSAEFIEYFQKIILEYYRGRLKLRKKPALWP